ncbi:hypothetical protein NPIL_9981 [Nephila pilipes]|uniref:Uncharacterized protein n=1 Tax=Nephila pilipes TaxID=299642 RepID=A0A8X6UJY5_NEPPI|nr:hypothetical protein NPIL_9981 [Nephila pilipes]
MTFCLPRTGIHDNSIGAPLVRIYQLTILYLLTRSLIQNTIIGNAPTLQKNGRKSSTRYDVSSTPSGESFNGSNPHNDREHLGWPTPHCRVEANLSEANPHQSDEQTQYLHEIMDEVRSRSNPRKGNHT